MAGSEDSDSVLYDWEACSRAAEGSYTGLMLALTAAASELGLTLGAFSFVGAPFPAGKEAFMRLPPDASPATGWHPDNEAPEVHVRLGRGDLDKTRRDMIDAVVEAAAHPWYRTGNVDFVYEPLIGLWPSLRSRGPRPAGLAERLDRVLAPASGDPMRWFRTAAEQATVEAYLAGAPVALLGTLVLECGSHALMHVDGPNRPRPLVLSISAVEGDTYDETIESAVTLVLRGHGITPADGDYADKARFLRAAMVASTVELPDTVEALSE